MYCSKCGTELINGICPNCGNVENNNQTYSTALNGQPVQISNVPVKEDKSNIGLNILSFLIPIFGIIWYFVKKDERPKEAKGTLKTAIVSIIINVVIAIVLFALMFIGLFAGVKGLNTVVSEQNEYVTSQIVEEEKQENKPYIVPSTTEEYLPELSHSIAYQDYVVEIGDAKVKLPILLSDFYNKTDFHIKNDCQEYDEMRLKPGESTTITFLSSDKSTTLYLEIRNTQSGGEPKPLYDCMVVGISQYRYDGIPVTFANGMQTGMATTSENIKSAFGEPYVFSEEGGYCRLTYFEDYEMYGSDRQFTITIEDGVINEITTRKLR